VILGANEEKGAGVIVGINSIVAEDVSVCVG
jgi:hypothetical protein